MRYRPFLFSLLVLLGCRQNPPEQNPESIQKPAAAVQAPDFNPDSAYSYIGIQVGFGFRIPNTPAHDRCADWLISKLKQYTTHVEVQQGRVIAYNGTKLDIKNIMAEFNPGRQPAVLLVSHWDSRPWADQDSVEPKKPTEAASDGASGVGVILEIARQISLKQPEINVKVLLVDAEDYGTPEFERQDNQGSGETYCLGTQYWANHLDKTKYTADYGVVLDMVGGPNARFLHEEYSRRYQFAIDKVWEQARQLGFSNYFINNQTGPITDDHVFVGKDGGVPCIDIIDYDASRPKGFPFYWHTHADNMKIIDKATLKAVGQTLLSVIYHEKGGKI